MRNKSEIYKVRFNKLPTDKDLLMTVYTVGVPVIVDSKLITPLKIAFNKEKTHIITYFDDDTRHTIFYEKGVEIFERLITNATKVQDTTNGRAV